jgi:hypothetical protein
MKPHTIVTCLLRKFDPSSPQSDQNIFDPRMVVFIDYCSDEDKGCTNPGSPGANSIVVFADRICLKPNFNYDSNENKEC